MKLGKKGKQNDLMSALGGEADAGLEPEPEPQPQSQLKAEVVEVSADVLEKVEQQR